MGGPIGDLEDLGDLADAQVGTAGQRDQRETVLGEDSDVLAHGCGGIYAISLMESRMRCRATRELVFLGGLCTLEHEPIELLKEVAYIHASTERARV